MEKKIEIRFAKKTESKALSAMSKAFAKEGCCNNIIADPAEYFLDKKVAVAICDNEIVGYCYGEVETEDRKLSYADVGDKYYELEEIYVLPSFRNMKIGEKLFNFTQKYAIKEGCKTIRLNAVSKNYKQLLKFYIDNLGMDFISAYLIKKI